MTSPDPNEQLTELVLQWKQGSQQAAAALFERYAARLIALASSRLPDKLSQRVDPEDVMQSVYRCFFAGVQDGRYQVHARDDLWQLLVTLTISKVRQQIRDNQLEKRDVNRERSFDVATSMECVQEHAASREATPAEALALVDEVQAAMRQLTPRDRQILELRLQGYAMKDIAQQVKISFATVRRTLKDVQQQLQEWYASR